MAYPTESLLRAREFQVKQEEQPGVGERMATGFATGAVKGGMEEIATRKKSALEEASDRRKFVRESIIESLKRKDWEMLNPVTKEWESAPFNIQVEALRLIGDGKPLPENIRLVDGKGYGDEKDGMLTLTPELRALWQKELGYQLPEKIAKGTAGLYTAAVSKASKKDIAIQKNIYQTNKDTEVIKRWSYDRATMGGIDTRPEAMEETKSLYKEITGKEWVGKVDVKPEQGAQLTKAEEAQMKALGYREEDIKETMKVHSLTRRQVFEKLKAK